MEQNSEIVQYEPPRLTPKESAALRYWQNSRQPEISPDTAARMFTLFLQGQTTEQIRSLNNGFSLGQVVQARIKGEWDRLRDEYQRDLLELTRSRALQTTLESTNFVADMLAVANVEFGEKLRKYLLTRNEMDLGALRIDSLKDYKDAVALLQALTGQDKQQKIGGELIVKHEVGATAVSSATAAQAIEKLLGK